MFHIFLYSKILAFFLYVLIKGFFLNFRNTELRTFIGATTIMRMIYLKKPFIKKASQNVDDLLGLYERLLSVKKSYRDDKEAIKLQLASVITAMQQNSNSLSAAAVNLPNGSQNVYNLVIDQKSMQFDFTELQRSDMFLEESYSEEISNLENGIYDAINRVKEEQEAIDTPNQIKDMEVPTQQDTIGQEV